MTSTSLRLLTFIEAGHEHEFVGNDLEQISENRRDSSVGSNTDDKKTIKRNGHGNVPTESSPIDKDKYLEANQLDVTKMSKKRSFRQIDGVPDKNYPPTKKIIENENVIKVAWLDTVPNRKLFDQIEIDYELIFDQVLERKKLPLKSIIKKKEIKRI